MKFKERLIYKSVNTCFRTTLPKFVSTVNFFLI
jgi:hypothetical protein